MVVIRVPEDLLARVRLALRKKAEHVGAADALPLLQAAEMDVPPDPDAGRARQYRAADVAAALAKVCPPPAEPADESEQAQLRAKKRGNQTVPAEDTARRAAPSAAE